MSSLFGIQVKQKLEFDFEIITRIQLLKNVSYFFVLGGINTGILPAS